MASRIEPFIRLNEALHLERREPHPGRGDRLRLAEGKSEAPDGKRVRRRRPLQVDIEAIVQGGQALTIARPAARTVGHEADPMRSVILDLDLHRTRSPSLVHVDRVADYIW